MDLNGNAIFQNGTSIFPWLRVGRAHAEITTGTMHIAPGHYRESLTLNKTVTLNVNGNGPVVIGEP